jgi:hypothetical protein
MDGATLEATVAHYNACVDAGEDDVDGVEGRKYPGGY